MQIKVVFFIDSFRIGGMHKQVLYLAKHLDRSKFHITVCVQSDLGGLASDFLNCGVNIVSLKWSKRLQLSVFKHLIAFLKKERPDILFITAPQNLIYYQIARLFYRSRTIQIGSFRAMNFWMGHLGILYKPIDMLLSVWMIFTSRVIVVNSLAMENRYSNYLLFLSKRKFRVIYNGSDFNFPITKSPAILRQELKITSSDIIITMIARLDPWKDFDTLLEAAILVLNKHEHVKFLLIGDGELRSYIETKILHYGIQEKVIILGEKKDIYNYINVCDISVLSTNGEGFSNSILESMAFAKPVVATKVGGNIELLEEYGLLVPKKSPGQMAKKLESLILSEELRLSIGLKCRNKIKQLCDLDNYTKSYERLFAESFNRK